MANKNTEWKRVSFKTDPVEFAEAKSAHVEVDGDSLICLTFTLKSGRVIRLRKADYSMVVEEPVIAMQTLYIAKTSKGLQQTFKSSEEAEEAVYGIEGAEVSQVQVPLKRELLPTDLPF